MSPLEVAVVAGAGACGALVRHELTVDRPLLALHLVNIGGSLLLGVVLAVDRGGVTLALAGAGLFGGLTSFSSWVVGARSVVREAPRPAIAQLVHLLLPAVLAVLAAALGVGVGRAIGVALTGGGA